MKIEENKDDIQEIQIPEIENEKAEIQAPEIKKEKVKTKNLPKKDWDSCVLPIDKQDEQKQDKKYE